MPGITRVSGGAVALDRANVDTDQIIPASWLKHVGRTGFADGLFGGWRADPGFVLNRPGAAAARVLVAGPNFGCGSSREHAVWALQDFGFQAVVSASFADIFRGNCVSAGLVPVEAAEPDVARRVAAGGAHPDPHVGGGVGGGPPRPCPRPGSRRRSRCRTSPSGGCWRDSTTWRSPCGTPARSRATKRPGPPGCRRLPRPACTQLAIRL